jgi:hypothetical protein
MITRTSILAMAALAAITTTALVPTSASAHGHFGGGHFGGGHFGGGHFGGGHWGGGHWGGNHWGGNRWGGNHWGGNRWGNHWGNHWGGNRWGYWNGWNRYWYPRWHRPYYYGYNSYGTPSYSSGPTTMQQDSQPSTQSYMQSGPSQNCLSKNYLQDGSVVFADNCTKETAISGPEGPKPDQQQGPMPEPKRF